MFDVKQEIEAIKAEQQMIAKNYQEAKDVMTNCERKLLELQGQLKMAEKFANADEENEAVVEQ
tara:strand:+ start:331 stop:519 length:189 start_codon:yes stop_codon:yes gene_type:complete